MVKKLKEKLTGQKRPKKETVEVARRTLLEAKRRLGALARQEVVRDPVVILDLVDSMLKQLD